MLVLVRWIFIMVVCGCTSTRTVARPGDPRLRSGGHPAGFAISTTGLLRSRIDPNSKLRLRSNAGVWTKPILASEVFADAHGLWLPRSPARIVRIATRIEIEGASPALTALLVETKPRDAQLTRDGERWILTGNLRPWLEDLDRRADPDEPIGRVTAWTPQGLAVSLDAATYEDFFHEVVWVHAGWNWEDIKEVKVQNFSGGKSLALAAAVTPLVVAAAVIAAPFAALAGGSGGKRRQDHRIDYAQVATVVGAMVVIAATSSQTTDEFAATLAPAPVALSSRMFTLGARVRARHRGTLSLDGAVAFAGDHVATGLVGRLRYKDFYELGFGVRELFVHSKPATAAVFGRSTPSIASPCRWASNSVVEVTSGRFAFRSAFATPRDGGSERSTPPRRTTWRREMTDAGRSPRRSSSASGSSVLWRHAVACKRGVQRAGTVGDRCVSSPRLWRRAVCRARSRRHPVLVDA